MSLPDAANAYQRFMLVLQDAQDMVTAGAIGSVLAYTLRHAKVLLDVLDDERAQC
jgi:hypothetical protein